MLQMSDAKTSGCFPLHASERLSSTKASGRDFGIALVCILSGPPVSYARLKMVSTEQSVQDLSTSGRLFVRSADDASPNAVSGPPRRKLTAGGCDLRLFADRVSGSGAARRAWSSTDQADSYRMEAMDSVFDRRRFSS